MLTAPTPRNTESTILFRQLLPAQPSRQRLAVLTQEFQNYQLVPPLKSPSEMPLSIETKLCTVSPKLYWIITSTVFMTIQPRLHLSPLPAQPLTPDMKPILVRSIRPLLKVLWKPSTTAMEEPKLLLSPPLPLLLFPSQWSNPVQMRDCIKFSSLDSGSCRCHSMNLRIYFKTFKFTLI